VGGLGGQLEKAGEGVLEKVRNRLGAGKAVASALSGDPTAERQLGPRDVERAFAGFAAFAVATEPVLGAAAPATPPAPGGAPPRSMPLDLYQEQLAFVRDALQATLDGGPNAALLERVSAARTKIRALIDGSEIGWRPRLEALLWPPLDSASRDTAKQAASGASMEWCAAVSKPFRRSLAGKYPFNPGGDDAAIADLAEFFRPGGILWGFYDGALKADIQRTGEGFRFARQLGGVSGFRSELLYFLGRAQDVTATLFPAGATEPKVEFSVRVRPTPGVSVIWFEVDGQRFDYRNGPEEWHKLVWPGSKTPGASIRVKAAGGQEEVLQQEGDWGLYRLIEAGALKASPGGRDFTVSWSLPSIGARVTIDIRPSRSDAPFFGVRRPGLAPRFLGSFRAGVAPPASIGNGGPGCG
jgi:type VI secretion system protein ImpL